MKIPFKNPIPFLVFILYFFFSCKEKNTPGNTSKSINTDSTLHIKLQPVVSTSRATQYLYTTINEIKMEQEINDEKVLTENKINISMLYDITKDSSGNYQFAISYKDFKVYIKAGDMEKQVQATTAAGSFDPQERIFAAFDKAVVTVKVTPDGKILEVNGLDLIREKMYVLAKNNKDAISMIKSSLQQYLSAENFKKTFEQTFRVFPAEKMKIGHQWKINAIPVADMNINIPLQYTLKDVDGTNGIVGIEGIINLENQPIQVQGNSITVSLKGEQNGEVKVNLATGMVTYSESAFKAKGEMFILDTQVPVKMETKTITKGERIR